MSDMGFSANLTAGGNILPFRFVYLSAANTGSQTTAITQTVLGVTDGSLYLPSSMNASGYHAIAGVPINTQPSNVVQIEAGEAIAAGAFLMPEGAATGRAMTAAGATAVSSYMALEAAVAAGDVIRAVFVGHRGPVFA